MNIDEALYQLKQNIKMHEIEGTASNQNEREKALLDYITNLQEENEKVHKDFGELSEKYFFTKSRNEKAIEYIKNLTNFQIGYGLNENDIKRTMYASENNFVKELLEILNKENNNETI